MKGIARQLYWQWISQSALLLLELFQFLRGCFYESSRVPTFGAYPKNMNTFSLKK